MNSTQNNLKKAVDIIEALECNHTKETNKSKLMSKLINKFFFSFKKFNISFDLYMLIDI